MPSENGLDPVVGPLLLYRAAVDSETFTVDLHLAGVLNAEWVIINQDDTFDGKSIKYKPFKHHYQINSDKLQWVPLSGVYSSMEEAQLAIKEYLSRRQPIFLDKAGEILEPERAKS